MYKRILVPLDGSKLAECALAHVEALAKGCGTEEVILVSATERVRAQTRAPEARELYHAAGPQVTVTFGKKERQAQRYLGRVAKKLEGQGLKVRTDVVCWPPAETITGYAKESGADIIVMSSHGRTGPSRWTHGSVAEKVLRLSSVPVLVVRAPGCTPGM